jgi:hypothetical protein
MAKYTINHQYFNELNSSEQSYILGFLWADGHVRKDGYGVSIKVNERDKDIILYIRDKLESDHRISTVSQDRINITFCSKELASSLNKLGFPHNKTYANHIPNYGVDPLAFMRGLIDGDGSIWIDKRSNTWNIQVTGCLEIANWLHRYFGVGGVYPDHNVWKWQAGGNSNLKKIASKLLTVSNLPESRKTQKLREIRIGDKNG